MEHNVFDELYDSDAVHGFGSGTIRRNRMDHALPHGDGNHNDFIQIGEGGPWTIDGNWFGERTGGAASIWIDSIRRGVIHDVLVQNNVLTGHYAGQDVGIFIAGDDRTVALLPTNVRVINNTVVSGLLNSLRFGAAYSTIPLEQRPLVANNVGDRLAGMCDRIRSVDNVFAVGEACTASDVIGDAALDAGAPTAASALLLGRADPVARNAGGLLRLRAHGAARHRCDRARRLPGAAADRRLAGRERERERGDRRERGGIASTAGEAPCTHRIGRSAAARTPRGARRPLQQRPARPRHGRRRRTRGLEGIAQGQRARKAPLRAARTPVGTDRRARARDRAGRCRGAHDRAREGLVRPRPSGLRGRPRV